VGPIHGHGWREATEDVIEAASRGPQRHLGADEDDVHADGGAVDEGREPAVAPTAQLLLPRSRVRMGPHAEHVGDGDVLGVDPIGRVGGGRSLESGRRAGSDEDTELETIGLDETERIWPIASSICVL